MSSAGRALIVAGRQGASAMGKNYKAAFHALQQTASLQRLGWMGNAPLFATIATPSMKGSVTAVVANSGALLLLQAHSDHLNDDNSQQSLEET